MRSLVRKISSLGAGVALASSALLMGVNASAAGNETPADSAEALLSKVEKGSGQLCLISIRDNHAFGGCGGGHGSFVLVARSHHDTEVSSPVWYAGASVTGLRLKGDVEDASIFSVKPNLDRGKLLAEEHK